MNLLIKISYNKKFGFWEALTASANKDFIKIQKFGNDLNLNANTKSELLTKINNYNFDLLSDSSYKIID